MAGGGDGGLEADGGALDARPSSGSSGQGLCQNQNRASLDEMSLNSPPITELTVESGTFKLLNEWLAKWFDGGMHALPVQAPAMAWPKVNPALWGRDRLSSHSTIGTTARTRKSGS